MIKANHHKDCGTMACGLSICPGEALAVVGLTENWQHRSQSGVTQVTLTEFDFGIRKQGLCWLLKFFRL